jgi:hypothetical protein
LKISKNEPARTFRVGDDGEIELHHCADVELEPDEQVTFKTDSGTEYDVVKKSWGYYATPSLDGRLKSFGLRAVLVRSRGLRYLLLVESGFEDEFKIYCSDQNMHVLAWLDDPEL